MDFKIRAIYVELEDAWHIDWYNALVNFVNSCRKTDYQSIVVSYSNQVGDHSRQLLRKLENQGDIIVSPSRYMKTCDTTYKKSTGIRFNCITRAVGEQNISTCTEYILETGVSYSDLQCINQFALLTGKSISLNERTLMLLRLTIHELAANSIEHGIFTCPNPEMHIQLIIDDLYVKVDYRDNASHFPTSVESQIDITDQADRINKRGLGLIILNQLVNDLIYERKNEWNLTSYELKRNDDASTARKRRLPMNQLSINIVPMPYEDITVLKVEGDIGAESTSILEKHIHNVPKTDKHRLVLDLSESYFISSSGVGLLLGTTSVLRARGGDLYLMNVSKPLQEILVLVGVDDFFPFISNVRELLAPRV